MTEKSLETDTNSSYKSNEKSVEKLDFEKKKRSIKFKDDGDSDSSSKHIKNIDIYDRMNFKRIEIKRSSLKAKTNICAVPKLNITKFTDEIVKYVEEIPETEIQLSSKNINSGIVKKRTIKFATQKVTFQYPKDKEVIKSMFDEQIKEEDDEGRLSERKSEKNDDGNIFVFGRDEDDDKEKDHDNDHFHSEVVEIANCNIKEDDTEPKEKQHINLEVFEDK